MPASTPARRRSSAGSTAGWCASRPARPSAHAASMRWRPVACRWTRNLRCARRGIRRSAAADGGAHHAVQPTARSRHAARPRGLAAHRRHPRDGLPGARRRWPMSRCRRGLVWQAMGHSAFAQAVGQLRGSPLAQRQAHAQRLELSPVPFQALAIRREADGALLACGQFAREGELVGLYDVFTAEAVRGQGLARQLCARLLARARDEGARSRLPAGRGRQPRRPQRLPAPGLRRRLRVPLPGACAAGLNRLGPGAPGVVTASGAAPPCRSPRARLWPGR